MTYLERLSVYHLDWWQAHPQLVPQRAPFALIRFHGI
jgi:hypothetical protein